MITSIEDQVQEAISEAEVALSRSYAAPVFIPWPWLLAIVAAVAVLRALQGERL